MAPDFIRGRNPCQRMKRFYAPLAIVAATVLAVTVLNVFKPGTQKRPPIRPPAIPVEALRVQLKDFEVLIHSQGIVEPATQASLAAQVSGNVVSRNPQFERGGSFSKGDVLVTLDDRDYIAALKLAEANKSRAQVNLEEEQARSTAAIQDWKRQGYTRKPSPLVARLPQVAAAEAELASADAALIKAQLDLSRTRITAPFDGRVIADAIDIGNYVTPGSTLGTIVESHKMKVALPVSSQWRDMLDWQKAFAAATVTLPSNPGANWDAVISKASADISGESRQFYLIAEIDVDSASRQDIGLLIGDYVNANVRGRTLPNVFVVPRSALHDGSFVWVIENNKLYKRNVAIVWTDSEVAVINSGLQADELVNLTPVGPVISGTEVRLQQKPPEQTSTISNAETQTDGSRNL